MRFTPVQCSLERFRPAEPRSEPLYKPQGWDIFVGRPGRTQLQVWRPQGAGFGGAAATTYMLVCSNEIDAVTRGIDMHHDVPAAEHCLVQQGDVIGWTHQGIGIVDFAPDAEGCGWQVLAPCSPPPPPSSLLPTPPRSPLLTATHPAGCGW